MVAWYKSSTDKRWWLFIPQLLLGYCCLVHGRYISSACRSMGKEAAAVPPLLLLLLLLHSLLLLLSLHLLLLCCCHLLGNIVNAPPAQAG